MSEVPFPAASSSPSTAPSTSASASGILQSSMATTVFDDAESSKMAANIDQTFHAMSLAHHIHTVGFHHSQWSDITLTFFDCALKLHRIVLSRSPYLAHLMEDTPPGTTLHLSFIDENITEGAVVTAIHHLYNPCLHLVSPDLARSMLATSYLLGGMPEMVHLSYRLIHESLSQSTIIDLIYWLTRSPQTVYPNIQGYPGFPASPTTTANAPSPAHDDGWIDGIPTYGEWSKRLESDVVEYLTRIPSLEFDTTSLHTDTRFQTIYSQLPFNLFKLCTESPDLPMQTMQDRFAFAKKVISLRKKAVAPGMEESAVLGFNKGGMGVCVTRKSKRKSALWKVEG